MTASSTGKSWIMIISYGKVSYGKEDLANFCLQNKVLPDALSKTNTLMKYDWARTRREKSLTSLAAVLAKISAMDLGNYSLITC